MTPEEAMQLEGLLPVAFRATNKGVEILPRAPAEVIANLVAWIDRLRANSVAEATATAVKEERRAVLTLLRSAAQAMEEDPQLVLVNAEGIRNLAATIEAGNHTGLIRARTVTVEGQP